MTQIASARRKGERPEHYGVAFVTFDENGSDKLYAYWTPPGWDVQPGDKLKVIVREQTAPKWTTVRKVSGWVPIGDEHKCAFAHSVMARERQALKEKEAHIQHTIALISPLQLDSIPKEPTAMNIENQTLINGQNIKNLTDDQLFDLIADEEAKIKALRAIENKPQKLKDRLNKMQADIDHLIRLIDER